MKRAIATWLVSILAMMPGAQAREHIRIVGSSTMFPFAAVLAERFGQSSPYPTPVLEATGSGGGIQLFCSGLGLRSADVVSASRRMTDSEIALCYRNGVGDVLEILIGYDGLVVANQRQAPLFDLSRTDLYLALARWVPDPEGGGLISNPHQSWQDIRPDLPDMPLRIYGPPPTSGTRDAFVERVMLVGCRSFPMIESLAGTDPDKFTETCATLREDGIFIEAGESDSLIVSRLDVDATAIGLFGYSFLQQNTDRVKSLPVEGIAATSATLTAGLYPITRPLYFYLKTEHLDSIPGLDAFLAEMVSEQSLGAAGYLQPRGLIPLSPDDYAAMRQAIEQQVPLVRFH